MNIHHTIDYIEFAGKPMLETKAFYTTVFGWSFTDYGPDYTAFESATVSGGFDASVDPGASPLVILYSEKLVATREAVMAAGGRIVKEIFAFPGGRRFHFADPAGNILAVWSAL